MPHSNLTAGVIPFVCAGCPLAASHCPVADVEKIKAVRQDGEILAVVGPVCW